MKLFQACFGRCAHADGEHEADGWAPGKARTFSGEVGYYSQLYTVQSNGSEFSSASDALSNEHASSTVLVVVGSDGRLVPAPAARAAARAAASQPRSPAHPSRLAHTSPSPIAQPTAHSSQPTGAATPSKAAAGAGDGAHAHTVAVAADATACGDDALLSRQCSNASDYQSAVSFLTCRESFTSGDDVGNSLLTDDLLAPDASSSHPAASQRSQPVPGARTQLPVTQRHASSPVSIIETQGRQPSAPSSSTGSSCIAAAHDGSGASQLRLLSSLNQSHVWPMAGKPRLSGYSTTTVTSSTPAAAEEHEQLQPQQQQQHLEALQATLALYRQAGHPCGACQALQQYCQEAGVAPSQLKQLLPLLARQQQQPPAKQQQDAAAVASQPDEQRPSGIGSGVPRSSSLPLQEEGVQHLERLLDAAADMGSCLQHVLDDTGWQVVRDDTLKLMYRHQLGTTVHCFKGRCTLHTPIENLMALTREFDLVPTWNHHVAEAVVLRCWSDAELLGVAVLRMPWPLANVSLVVQAVGMDVLDTAGGFLVTFNTPEQRVDPALMAQAHLAKPNNMVLRMLRGSCIFFEPLPEEDCDAGDSAKAPGKRAPGPRVRATMEAHTDPGFKHLPAFIITFVLRVLAPYVYNMVVKLVTQEFSDPTKPLPARIPQRPLLYNMVRDRAAAFLARKARQQHDVQPAQPLGLQEQPER